MKMIFAFLAVAALLLAGCAGTPPNPKALNNSSVEPTCPDVRPYCPPGKEMYSTTDSNGCPVYRCRDIVPPPVVNNSSNTVPPQPPIPQMNNSSNGTLPSPPEANNSSQIVPPPEQQVKEFSVEAAQWTYSPSVITVNKGDLVRITLKNLDTSHGFALPQFDFDIKAGAGETVTGEFVADKAGIFYYRCSVQCGSGHGNMYGTLIVK